MGTAKFEVASGIAHAHVPTEMQSGDVPIAMVVHLLNSNDFVGIDEGYKPLSNEELAKSKGITSTLHDPFVIGQTRVQTAQSSVYMEFVAVPYSAEALRLMAPEEAEALIGNAITFASERGAELVGLCGFTSIVAGGGINVSNLGVPVTSGNTYAAITALQAVRKAADMCGLDMSRSKVVVLGATGMIGGTLISSFLGETKELVLVGNPLNPVLNRRRLVHHMMEALQDGGPVIEALIKADHEAEKLFNTGLIKELCELIYDRVVDVGVVCDSDVSVHLRSADVVICATNSTEHLVDVSQLKRAAIVLDLSRPHNVDKSMMANRPDVLFIDGGVVAFPGLPEFGIEIGVPAGHGLACMAETVILGLSGNLENTSLGERADRKTSDLLTGLADSFNFRLPDLITLDRPMVGSDWDNLVGARSVATSEGSLKQSNADEAHAYASALNQLEPQQQANLAHWLLERNYLECPDQLAVISPESGRQISYAGLWQKTISATQRLAEMPLQSGDVLAVVSEDSIEMLSLILACWWSGMVVVPVNPSLPIDDYTMMFSAVDVSNVFLGEGQGELNSKLQEHGFHCRFIEPLTVVDEAVIANAEETQPTLLDLSAPAIYLFSSGSTGRPKAIMHTHGDFVTANLNYAAFIGVQKGDRIFSVSRMFFAFGFLSVTYALFHTGISILAPTPSRKQELADMLIEYRPNLFFAVPAVFKFICDQVGDREMPAELRLCISAGETLTPSLYKHARETLGVEILDGIGCTESLSTFISNLPGQSKAGSTGIIVPGFEARLIDDSGRTCSVGRVGVMWIKGNTLAAQIHNEPSLTETVFRSGWFNTNDLFYMDEQSHFHYVGRANDVLKINGCWVAPTRIEDVINTHPDIEECAVIPSRDEFGLIRPKAVLVLKSASSYEAGMRGLADQLKLFCKKNLGVHQYPHIFEVADSLPRTASGKLQRALLK